MFGHDNEPVTLKRDVEAIVVPAGFPVPLEKGSLVYITQAMGGSFTIFFEGNLYRIAGRDADALGKEPIKPPELPEDATDEDFEKLVWDQLRTIYDPEIPINIVDLGLIYSCRISRLDDQQRYVYIEMTLTAPGCGMGEILVEDVKEKVGIIPTVGKVDVELVFEPAWDQSRMSEAARLEAGLL
ncbi:MAG: putative Fe-S cluster assembly protein SufT [Gammaproteobacteria bacterium]|nr:MAG: putative Fe-S cluster assembly protein SufT [Gammaproteobacteria bacterium]